MSASPAITTQTVTELVLANRVIRAPYYEKAADDEVRFTDLDRGLQWGADTIPALQGLFHVEHAIQGDDSDSWVGFARHWRGGTIRIDFDRFVAENNGDAVLVVTGVYGRTGDGTITDEDFGDITVPAPPTEDEWSDRQKRYTAIRRSDDTDGSDSVQAYIASLPGWKRDVGATFDDVIRLVVPDVRSAVKWHQPFYAVENQGWFAVFSGYSKHVKLTFLCESYLEPEPPNAKAPDNQSIDLRETDSFDEEQIAAWVRQAAANPGMNW